MKTQNQKQEDKFSNRVATWWSNIVDWAEDVDFGQIIVNVFLILLIGGAVFGFIYLGISSVSKEKNTNSKTDSVALVETPHCTKKPCVVDWDLDTVTVLAPNEKGYKLHFKGKVPYFLTIENLDTAQ